MLYSRTVKLLAWLLILLMIVAISNSCESFFTYAQAFSGF
jgi:hypothetical protein